jgi:hypothetical protein
MTDKLALLLAAWSPLILLALVYWACKRGLRP